MCALRFYIFVRIIRSLFSLEIKKYTSSITELWIFSNIDYLNCLRNISIFIMKSLTNVFISKLSQNVSFIVFCTLYVVLLLFDKTKFV